MCRLLFGSQGKHVLQAICWLLLCPPLLAQNSGHNLPVITKQQVNHYTIPKLKGLLEIDGILSETQWQQALTIELNVVTQPYENTAAPVKTEVLIFEDGRN